MSPAGGLPPLRLLPQLQRRAPGQCVFWGRGRERRRKTNGDRGSRVEAGRRCSVRGGRPTRRFGGEAKLLPASPQNSSPVGKDALLGAHPPCRERVCMLRDVQEGHGPDRSDGCPRLCTATASRFDKRNLGIPRVAAGCRSAPRQTGLQLECAQVCEPQGTNRLVPDDQGIHKGGLFSGCS